MIRDQELARLEKYAQGLNIRVTYKTYKPGDPGATMTTDGTELTLYIWPRMSKRKLILNFIHELGHAMSFIYNNRKTKAREDLALHAEASRKNGDPVLPKRLRKLIYEGEKFDAGYRAQIWHEVGIKMHENILKMDIELDNWVYLVYYETGEMPTGLAIKNKELELKEKYGKV
jgi:hypothetical protein